MNHEEGIKKEDNGTKEEQREIPISKSLIEKEKYKHKTVRE